MNHLEQQFTQQESTQFTPLAILDIGQDGIPEILYHLDLGESWSDHLLQLNATNALDDWKIKASSVGGATL